MSKLARALTLVATLAAMNLAAMTAVARKRDRCGAWRHCS
jgi:hypothetical protein